MPHDTFTYDGKRYQTSIKGVGATYRLDPDGTLWQMAGPGRWKFVNLTGDITLSRGDDQIVITFSEGHLCQ